VIAELLVMKSDRYFSVSSAEKTFEFSALSGDLLDVQYVLLGSSESTLSRVMPSTALQCMHLVLEILKQDKICGGGGDLH